MEDLSGRQFGSYQLLTPVNDGGLVTAYRAYQPSMERAVAVRVLPRIYGSDQSFGARFDEEARRLARLEHPYIMPIYDFGLVDGYAYLVTRLVEDGTLVDWMHAAPSPFSRISVIINEIAGALDHAHRHGYLHCDLKPSNILVDAQGHCLVGDFGLATMMAESTPLAGSGAWLGTPEYMSPEQCLGQPLDARTDVYSLAVILYELMAGRPPFKAETPMAIAVQHIHAPLPLPSQFNAAIPTAVEKVIVKALAKDREQRYASAGELAAAMQTAMPQVGDLASDHLAPDPAPAHTENTRAPLRAPPVRPVLATLVLISGWALAGLTLIAAQFLNPGEYAPLILPLIGWGVGCLVTLAVLRAKHQIRRAGQMVISLAGLIIVGPLVAGAVGLLTASGSLAELPSPDTNDYSQWLPFLISLVVMAAAALVIGGGLAGLLIVATVRQTKGPFGWRNTLMVAGGWAVAHMLLGLSMAVAGLAYTSSNWLCGLLTSPILFALIGAAGAGTTLTVLTRVPDTPPVSAIEQISRHLAGAATWITLAWLATIAGAGIVALFVLVSLGRSWNWMAALAAVCLAGLLVAAGTLTLALRRVLPTLQGWRTFATVVVIAMTWLASQVLILLPFLVDSIRRLRSTDPGPPTRWESQAALVGGEALAWGLAWALVRLMRWTIARWSGGGRVPGEIGQVVLIWVAMPAVPLLVLTLGLGPGWALLAGLAAPVLAHWWTARLFSTLGRTLVDQPMDFQQAALRPWIDRRLVGWVLAGLACWSLAAGLGYPAGWLAGGPVAAMATPTLSLPTPPPVTATTMPVIVIIRAVQPIEAGGPIPTEAVGHFPMPQSMAHGYIVEMNQIVGRPAAVDISPGEFISLEMIEGFLTATPMPPPGPP